ncbi:methyltransferase FkbM-like protein [Litoreibacter ponti]|uniref:Methyltransferase FkbM-like protein n=1 Tax=Litoreibacter ponti TaxID=1510457 RepID=A0A2T6BKR0_9RHOB|nr:FkbM family methyltransferase [Litoreibacter ponti]PTX56632.1 methyltransferase FkbM-like protein [Litoreibacter ponti]
MPGLKQSLSRWNHNRKRKGQTARTTKRVINQSAQPNAVPWDEVKEFLAQFEPMQTGHELVRIGPDFDGGYLVPDDIEGLTAVFSPGVSDTLGFDREMADRVDHVYLADASVDRPSGMMPNMSFEKKFLGTEDSGDIMTMDAWVGGNSGQGDDLLLQMDIEGAEYDVLNATSDEVLGRFRVILIEYHDLDRVFDRAQFEKMSKAIARLGETHVLCHLHTNNTALNFKLKGRDMSRYVEATYLRRDRVTGPLTPAQIPHTLDQRNVEEFDDVPTPAFWRWTS